MKRPSDGTELPRDFAVDHGPSWHRSAKHRSEADLQEIAARLAELQYTFGRPHAHGDLGLRRLTARLFEFRISRGVRVVFAWVKSRTIRLTMCGKHDEVRAWLKENA